MTTLKSIERPRCASVTEVRGILIGASTLTLREQGLHDRYLAHLAPEHRHAMQDLAPSGWGRLALAEAHYRACDALSLSDDEKERNAGTVLDRIHGATLATLSRIVQKRVLQPSWLNVYLPRIWGRVFKGGSLRIQAHGPTSMVVHCEGLSLFRSAYFRAGFRVHLERGIGVFAPNARARPLGPSAFDGRFLVSWGG